MTVILQVGRQLGRGREHRPISVAGVLRNLVTVRDLTNRPQPFPRVHVLVHHRRDRVLDGSKPEPRPLPTLCRPKRAFAPSSCVPQAPCATPRKPPAAHRVPGDDPREPRSLSRPWRSPGQLASQVIVVGSHYVIHHLPQAHARVVRIRLRSGLPTLQLLEQPRATLALDHRLPHRKHPPSPFARNPCGPLTMTKIATVYLHERAISAGRFVKGISLRGSGAFRFASYDSEPLSSSCSGKTACSISSTCGDSAGSENHVRVPLGCTTAAEISPSGTP